MVAPTLALLAILSLVGAICAVIHGKQNDAFYLFHFRAWELLSGSLLALFPILMSKQTGSITLPVEAKSTASTLNGAVLANLETRHALFSIIGLLMVLIPYVIISSKTPFPGAVALSPVIGTALLIRYGQSGWVSWLLSWRPFVATGKISYSLYLWHWPVTVFWKYATYDQLYYYDYMGMFLLSLLLGYLSWKFIEYPVRTSPLWTMRRSFTFATSGIVVLVGLGIACVYSKSLSTILHPDANAMAGKPRPLHNLLVSHTMLGIVRRVEASMGDDALYQELVEERQRLFLDLGWDGCSTIGVSSNKYQLLLVGDSHSGSLRYGLDHLLKEKSVSGYTMGYSGKAVYDMRRPEAQAVLKKVAELPQGSAVLLAQCWLHHTTNEEHMFAQLEQFSRQIQSAGKRLFIVTDVPNYKYSPSEIAARLEIIKPRRVEPEWMSLSQSEEAYNSMQGEINKRLEQICNMTGAMLIPAHLALKEKNAYIAFDKQGNQSVPLYRDGDHLFPTGSLRISKYIMPYLFPKPIYNREP